MYEINGESALGFRTPIIIDDAVPAALLSQVKPLVGRSHKRSWLYCIHRRGRDTDRRADGIRRHCVQFRVKPPLQFGLKALCHRNSRIDGAVGQNRDELIAAITTREVGRPQTSLESLPGNDENPVTKLVAADIIHRFEAIEIDHEQGCGQGGVIISGELFVQAILEESAVIDARQRVAHCLRANGFIALAVRQDSKKIRTPINDSSRSARESLGKRRK